MMGEKAGRAHQPPIPESNRRGHTMVHEVSADITRQIPINGLLQLLPHRELPQRAARTVIFESQPSRAATRISCTRSTQNGPVEGRVNSQTFTVANLVVYTGHMETQVHKASGPSTSKTGCEYSGPNKMVMERKIKGLRHPRFHAGCTSVLLARQLLQRGAVGSRGR